MSMHQLALEMTRLCKANSNGVSSRKGITCVEKNTANAEARSECQITMLPTALEADRYMLHAAARDPIRLFLLWSAERQKHKILNNRKLADSCKRWRDSLNTARKDLHSNRRRG